MCTWDQPSHSCEVAPPSGLLEIRTLGLMMLLYIYSPGFPESGLVTAPFVTRVLISMPHLVRHYPATPIGC